MSWAECQNNLIDANFQLQKSLEIYSRQNLIQKGQGDESIPSDAKGLYDVIKYHFFCLDPFLKEARAISFHIFCHILGDTMTSKFPFDII